ncbi:hypothetical protein LCGC14_2650710 [marine sediment metagenome]|uniref:Phosphoadenosine phosphosulphate reductase domain-containing protein n=1 Tax=marine sediment metagenome TaxID=412755 RepID=A0A0F8ZUU1_9ZZZZ
MKQKIIVIADGQGVQSKCLPIALYEKHPDLREYWDNTIILDLFADTQDEEDDIYKDIVFYQRYLQEHNYPPLIILSRGSLSQEYYEQGIIPTRQFRHCTDKFKIRVIRKYIRSYLEENNLTLKDVDIRMLIGITIDESIRIRDSEVQWIKNEFPFCYELKFTRKDCEKFLDDRNIPYHKSGCDHCVFKNAKKVYKSVAHKPKRKQFIINWEKKARAKNSKMLFFTAPIEKLFSKFDRQKKLPEFIELDIEIDIQSEECDTGYCFL